MVFWWFRGKSKLIKLLKFAYIEAKLGDGHLDFSYHLLSKFDTTFTPTPHPNTQTLLTIPPFL